jgi:hypothetical protein
MLRSGQQAATEARDETRSGVARMGWLVACASLWLGVALAQDSAQPLAGGSAPQPAAGTPVPATVKVVLKTSLGDIVLAVETERAPRRSIAS